MATFARTQRETDNPSVTHVARSAIPQRVPGLREPATSRNPSRIRPDKEVGSSSCSAPSKSAAKSELGPSVLLEAGVGECALAVQVLVPPDPIPS
jgi:hypothetical protein